MRLAFPACAALFLALLPAAPAAAKDRLPRLRNGAFEKGLDGWTVETGARSGRGDVGSSLRVEDGALRATGTPATTTWKMATQRIPIRAGQRVLLTVRARSKGLKRAKGQFRNANAFLRFDDESGTRIHFTGTALLDGDREWVTLYAHDVAPELTRTVTVGLFASQTGDMWFDDADLRIEDLAAVPYAARSTAFDALRIHLERTYPFWGLDGKPDPAKLFDAHFDKVVTAEVEEEFFVAVRELLKELDDPHVWVRYRGRIEAVSEPRRPERNWNLEAIAKRLTTTTMKRRHVLAGLIGRGKESIGYCMIGSFQLYTQDVANLDNALASLRGARSLILDVRPNGGGNEAIAQQVARLWAKETTPYSRARERDPTRPALDAFYEPDTHVLVPHEQRKPDKRRVCVLQGPVCMSSTEAFLLMAKALPTWTTVGQPSWGASANPKPFPLLPGVQVMLSTWQALDLDGKCIEGVGVAPDVEVKHDPESELDVTLERAIELLGGK